MSALAGLVAAKGLLVIWKPKGLVAVSLRLVVTLPSEEFLVPVLAGLVAAKGLIPVIGPKSLGGVVGSVFPPKAVLPDVWVTKGDIVFVVAGLNPVDVFAPPELAAVAEVVSKLEVVAHELPYRRPWS